MLDPARLAEPYSWDFEGDWWSAEVGRRLRRTAWLYAPGPHREERLALDRALCAQDFWYWADQYAWIVDANALDPEKRIIPFVGWPRQRELVEWLNAGLARGSIHHGETLIAPKARKLGVSYTVMMWILHMWLFEGNFSALLGSKREEEVDQRGNQKALFQKIRTALYRLPAHIRPPMKKGRDDKHRLLINPDNGSIIAGDTTSESFGQSDRKRVIFIDEAARIQPNIMASIMTASISVADLRLLVYNPGAKMHVTWQMHQGENRLPDRCIFEMGWRANPTRGEEFKRSKIRPIGDLTAEQFGSAFEVKYGYDLTGLIWSADRGRTEYDDDSPEFTLSGTPRGRYARAVGGWDFGTGPSDIARVQILLELSAKPTLWIDDELVWSQTEWKVCAADARQTIDRYADGYAIDYGDPAGVNRESDQGSWITNLGLGGVPCVRLDPYWNTRDGKEEAIRYVQTMLDEGTLRVHRRCRAVWDVLHEWRRKVPAGMDPRDYPAAYVGPEKGRLSHVGDALIHGVIGANLVLDRELRAAGSAPDDTEGGGFKSRLRVRDLTRGLAA